MEPQEGQCEFCTLLIPECEEGLYVQPFGKSIRVCGHCYHMLED